MWGMMQINMGWMTANRGVWRNILTPTPSNYATRRIKRKKKLFKAISNLDSRLTQQALFHFYYAQLKHLIESSIKISWLMRPDRRFLCGVKEVHNGRSTWAGTPTLISSVTRWIVTKCSNWNCLWQIWYSRNENGPVDVVTFGGGSCLVWTSFG